MMKAILEPEVIIKTCSDIIGVTPEQVKSKFKYREFVKARHLSIYFIKRFTDLSLARIGSEVNRDHATVIFAIKSVTNQSDIYKAYHTQFNKILFELDNKAECEFEKYAQFDTDKT